MHNVNKSMGSGSGISLGGSGCGASEGGSLANRSDQWPGV